jgi:hypothetical protein
MNELLTNQPVIEEIELPNSGKSAANNKTALVINNKTKTIEFSVPSKFTETKSYVGRSPIQGLGCFAKQNINSGEIIEEVSAILLDTTTRSNRDWVVTKYCFTWPCDTGDSICAENGPTYVMPTGNAMIYNHSDSPNSYWIYDKAMKRIFLAALRNIEEGEEIFWYYGDGYAKTLREGNLRLEKPKTSGCSSCQKRNLDDSDTKKDPTNNENNFSQKHLRVGTENPFSSRLQTKNDLYAQIMQLDKNPIEFRSMVVPERKLDDNIQNG